MCVTVPFDHFEKVLDVRAHETATLPCRASPGTKVVWYYQRYCDHFEHGPYACSPQTAVTIGNKYEVCMNSDCDYDLRIIDAMKNMTGLYTCKNSHRVISGVFLNVMCEYNFVLLLHHYCL